MLNPALCPKCHHQLILPPNPPPFYQNTLLAPPPTPSRSVVLNVEVNLKLELPKLCFGDGRVVSKALQCGGGIVITAAEESSLETNSTTTACIENSTTSDCIDNSTLRLETISPSPIRTGYNPFLSPCLENANQVQVESHSTVNLESNPSPASCLENTFPIEVAENPPPLNLECPQDLFSIRLNQQSIPLQQQNLPKNIPLSKEICQRDLDTLTATVRVLRMSGFYYESLSQQQALELLTNKSPGTFLVRNSSNPQHIFALSVQTLKGPTSVRLHYLDGYFYFDCDGYLQEKIAKFPCVIQLIEHYIRTATRPPGGEKETQQVWLDYFTRKYYSRILLVKPLRKEIPKLQQLCRNAVYREGVPVTNGSIPFSLVCYLKQYPYSV